VTRRAAAFWIDWISRKRPSEKETEGVAVVEMAANERLDRCSGGGGGH